MWREEGDGHEVDFVSFPARDDLLHSLVCMSKIKWRHRTVVLGNLLGPELTEKAWGFTERWVPERLDPEGVIDREGLRVSEEEFLRETVAKVWSDAGLAHLVLKSFFEAYLERVWMINPVLVPAGRHGRHHWVRGLLEQAQVPERQAQVIYQEVIKDLGGWCYLVEPPDEADQQTEFLRNKALLLNPADSEQMREFCKQVVRFGHDWEPTLVPDLFGLLVQSNGDPHIEGALEQGLAPWQMDEQQWEITRPLWQDAVMDRLEPTFRAREQQMARN